MKQAASGTLLAACITMIIPPKRRLTSPGLQGVMSQKTKLFIWYTFFSKRTRVSSNQMLKEMSFLEAEYSSTTK
jgi:hypothetical protein